jgi:hypothetical protein
MQWHAVPSAVHSHLVATGSPVVVVGSPFGCLQPRVLFNSVRFGHISNTLPLCSPPGLETGAGRQGISGKASRFRAVGGAVEAGLLILDVKALPGMQLEMVLCWFHGSSGVARLLLVRAGQGACTCQI